MKSSRLRIPDLTKICKNARTGTGSGVLWKFNTCKKTNLLATTAVNTALAGKGDSTKCVYL